MTSFLIPKKNVLVEPCGVNIKPAVIDRNGIFSMELQDLSPIYEEAAYSLFFNRTIKWIFKTKEEAETAMNEIVQGRYNE